MLEIFCWRSLKTLTVFALVDVDFRLCPTWLRTASDFDVVVAVYVGGVVVVMMMAAGRGILRIAMILGELYVNNVLTTRSVAVKAFPLDDSCGLSTRAVAGLAVVFLVDSDLFFELLFSVDSVLVAARKAS